MGHGVTVRHAAAELVRLRLCDMSRIQVRIDDDIWDEDVEWFGLDSPAEAMVSLMCEVRLGVSVPVDGIEVELGYRAVFRELEECVDGAFRITDVEVGCALLDDDEDFLRFRCDGEPREWGVEHLGHKSLDQMAFVENLASLTPPGSRRWHFAENQEIPDNCYLLGESEPLRELGAEWGIDLVRM